MSCNCFWAPWGDRSWVSVIRLPSGELARVFAKNNAPRGGARFRVQDSRLVPRDPKLEGRDKPAFWPSETGARKAQIESVLSRFLEDSSTEDDW